MTAMTPAPFVDALLSPHGHNLGYGDTTQAAQAHPYPAQDPEPIRARHTSTHRQEPQGQGRVRSGDQGAAEGTLTVQLRNPDRGAMWCYGCGGRVDLFDGHAICGCGAQLCESPVDCGNDACPYRPATGGVVDSPPEERLQVQQPNAASGSNAVSLKPPRWRRDDACGREHTYRDSCVYADWAKEARDA